MNAYSFIVQSLDSSYQLFLKLSIVVSNELQCINDYFQSLLCWLIHYGKTQDQILLRILSYFSFGLEDASYHFDEVNS